MKKLNELNQVCGWSRGKKVNRLKVKCTKRKNMFISLLFGRKKGMDKGNGMNIQFVNVFNEPTIQATDK